MLVLLVAACTNIAPPAPPTPISSAPSPVGAWLEKRLTQCAEEWQEWVANENAQKYKPWNSEGNSEYNTKLMTDAIVAFYTEDGISITDIELMLLPSEPQCEACNCLSDKVLRIKTDNPDYFIAQGYKTDEQIQKTKIQFGNARQSSDPYIISSYDASISTLTLTVSHGGGCEEHDYMLVADEQFKESAPPEVDIRLIHDANGDTCEAGIQKELTFDLSPLRKRFADAYPGSDQLRVNILDAEKNQHTAYTMEFY